jgi:hypothetical protein
MNAKKAKALRKIIRNLEKMRQGGEQVIPEVAYSENVRNRKQVTVSDFDDKGEMVEKTIPIAAGTITVEARSKRGLYNHLKKEIAKNHTSVDVPVPSQKAAVPPHVLSVGSEFAHTAEDIKQ